MKIINRLIILVVILNLFIIVGIGHGFGFLGIVEFLSIKDILQGKAKFSLYGSYNDTLYTASTLAAIGQIIMMFAYFQKIKNQKIKIVYFGLLILLISFSLLVVELSSMTISSFGILAGTPFLIAGVALIIIAIINNRNPIS